MGEEISGLVEQRDQQLGVNSGKKRQERIDLIPFTNPQSGVDALKDKFTNPTSPLSGVRNCLETPILS